MAKKKRNKKYQGRDAAQEGPIIKKFEVDGKTNWRDWVSENKLKIIGWSMRSALAVIIAGIIWIIYLVVT